MTEGAMIAFLPMNGSWCKQELPHMTLVYAGETNSLQPSDFNALAKDAITVSRLTGSFVLPVTGIEEFGNEDKVDVLTLHPTPQLLAARKIVEHWNKSEFKDFKPHATIGPSGSAAGMHNAYTDGYANKSDETLPTQLYFNRIGAFWGKQSLIFNLD